jgi:hypothetical protein
MHGPVLVCLFGFNAAGLHHMQTYVICGKLYHTEPGRLEYHITGVCESCYDGFMSEQGSKSFRDLSTIGYDLMMLWLIISRVHTSVIGLPAGLIVAISTGTFQWPQVRLPASASAVALR